MSVGLHEWGMERFDDLLNLTALAFPEEELLADDLVAGWERPEGTNRMVFGYHDGSGAVILAQGDLPEGPDAPPSSTVCLLAVDPSKQRRGLGRELLVMAEIWSVSWGGRALHLGGPPLALWPGVDTAWRGAVSLAEKIGFEPTSQIKSFAQPTDFRAPSPPGIRLQRLLEEEEITTIAGMVLRRWPGCADSFERSTEQACAYGAFEESTGRAVGFICHSTDRLGWIGPMGVEPDSRRRGIGSALLAAACQDLMVAGLEEAQVAHTEPMAFLEASGARPSREFVRYRKTAPDRWTAHSSL